MLGTGRCGGYQAVPSAAVSVRACPLYALAHIEGTGATVDWVFGTGDESPS